MCALHETGVVHRDLKPSNLLLADGGPDGPERVLVADLGLAKNLAQASGLTVVAGSAGYMPPEQQDGLGGIDERSDVYSLGAVLYHLVTGAVPDRPGEVRAPSALRPELPAEVERAVLRAMDPDREGRWPSAGAFAAELDRLAAPGGTSPAEHPPEPVAEPAPARRPKWRRHSAVAAGTAAVVLLGAGAAVKWLQQPSAPRTQRVHDATGRISVQVPGAWAAQVTDGGWSPSSLGLPGAHAPGMIVAQDVRGWSNLTQTDGGVFVGLAAGDASGGGGRRRPARRLHEGGGEDVRRRPLARPDPRLVVRPGGARAGGGRPHSGSRPAGPARTCRSAARRTAGAHGRGAEQPTGEGRRVAAEKSSRSA